VRGTTRAVAEAAGCSCSQVAVERRRRGLRVPVRYRFPTLRTLTDEELTTKTLRRLAGELGCSVITVSEERCRRGLVRTVGSGRPGRVAGRLGTLTDEELVGKSLRQLAEQAECSEGSVSLERRRRGLRAGRGRRRTSDTLSKLTDEDLVETSLRRLAEVTGCAATSVSRERRRRGLWVKPRRGGSREDQG
jgi:hypothetical protein